MLLKRFQQTLFFLTLLFPLSLMATPLFDAHLHYNKDDANYFTSEQIIKKLQSQNIKYAAITSTPPLLVNKLQQQAPDLIVPILGVYQTHNDKTNWHQDTGIISHIKSALKQHRWYGIGELHLRAKDRHSPIFHRIIKLAVKYKLPLLLHADPAVIDTVYDVAPNHPVIWAHAGTFPYPDLLADYLLRYPTLHTDLSVRDQRIAPNEIINDDWYELFIRFPDRFLIGVDTFSTNRWKNFDNAVKTIRHWLKQLPEDVAIKFKYQNAERIFKN